MRSQRYNFMAYCEQGCGMYNNLFFYFRKQVVWKGNCRLKVSAGSLLFIVLPELPTIEEVLPYGIEGQEHGSQRVEVGVGHPDAHSGIFLSEQLSAGHAVAVLLAQPLAETEMQSTGQHGGNTKEQDVKAVAFAVDENEVYGLSKGEQQQESPDVEGVVFILGQKIVSLLADQLQS